MAFERNNNAMDFEAMLRSHLQQSGALGDCAGFDPDAASAYLEQGLAPHARANYESHLALCHPCRQQLIQFARFSQADIYAAPPLPTVSWWQGVRQTVNARVGAWLGAFDLGWNGQTTAWAGGALVAALVAVFGMQALRPTPPASNASALTTEIAKTFASDSEVDVTTPQATPGAVSASPTTNMARATNIPAGFNPTIPRPEVTPNLNATAEFAPERLRASSDAVAFTNSQPVGAPPPAVQTLPGFANNSVQPLVVSQLNGPEVMTVGGGESLRLAEDEVSRNEIGSRLSLSPQDNPMRAASLKTTDRRAPAPQPERPVWRDRVLGFVPYKKEERERLEKLPIEEDAIKAMKIRIRDRVFYFANGAWVDMNYEPEMAWRVTRLVRGSAEYERVVAAEPGLKAYFAKGPITVIWGDKIYKVVGK